jgi:prevent-host-death family protein
MESVKSMSLGTFEAKNKLSALVEIASQGGRIWITKRGRRVALLSAGDEGSRAPVGDMVAAFRDISPETLASLGAHPLKGVADPVEAFTCPG